MNVLSAGAAKGLLQTIAVREGIAFSGEFGAVGAIKERLLAGAPCDVVVLTEKMIVELTVAGVLKTGSVITLGKVRTGIAVPSGATPKSVDTTDSFKQLLGNASRIYFPDPVRSTAGIHFMNVLSALGLAESLSSRFATYPNGAIAMRVMAGSGDASAVGVTQCSEILYTEGVQLLGALPGEFELVTTYSAGIPVNTSSLDNATRLLAALAAAGNRSTCIDAGFEPVD